MKSTHPAVESLRVNQMLPWIGQKAVTESYMKITAKFGYNPITAGREKKLEKFQTLASQNCEI
jgi:hypothetical protein